MVRQCFNVDVLLDPLWIDVLFLQLPHISRSVWEEWGVVMTFTVLSLTRVCWTVIRSGAFGAL